MNDEKTMDAVVRNLEIIGEAVRQLPAAWKDQNQNIPWSQMARMRNRIVHDDMAVDLELIWSIVQDSLPDLRTPLAEIRP